MNEEINTYLYLFLNILIFFKPICVSLFCKEVFLEKEYFTQFHTLLTQVVTGPLSQWFELKNWIREQIVLLSWFFSINHLIRFTNRSKWFVHRWTDLWSNRTIEPHWINGSQVQLVGVENYEWVINSVLVSSDGDWIVWIFFVKCEFLCSTEIKWRVWSVK